MAQAAQDRVDSIATLLDAWVQMGVWAASAAEGQQLVYVTEKAC